MSLDRVIQSLQSFVRVDDLRCAEAGPSVARVELGGTGLDVMFTAQETLTLVAVHVEFDEDDVARIMRAAGQSLEHLLTPYVQAAKTIPGVVAAGIGFELSPPTDLQEQSLQDAGIAVVFARDEENKSWSRRQTLPLVGHYAAVTGTR